MHSNKINNDNLLSTSSLCANMNANINNNNNINNEDFQIPKKYAPQNDQKADIKPSYHKIEIRDKRFKTIDGTSNFKYLLSNILF